MTPKVTDLYNDHAILESISQALYKKEPLTGPNGVITNLIKKAMEATLEGELDAHLQEEALEKGTNRKNGKSRKQVTSRYGTFELETPRDRNSSFSPQLVKKRQTIITDDIDAKILRLYSTGTSYEDIAHHIEDLYGLEISHGSISAITDRLLPEIIEWRNRPLESTYAVIFFDAMFYKIREEGTVKSKAVYNIMGINKEGLKDILGFYICDTEGATFWLSVLNDLKQRGVQDILIACIDGLKGFPQAIASAFPHTEIQLCIVHQIRHTLKLIPHKHKRAFIADLKNVYKASSKENAETQLQLLMERWPHYTAALKSWVDNWENLSTYFKFSQQIRTLIYTTNAIEGFHRQIRKYTKTKGAFSSENALLKILFCAINNISSKWSAPLYNWIATLAELELHFPGRLLP